MEAVLQSLVAGFPYLIFHFLVTVAIWVLGVVIYIYATPYNEIALVRAGNTAVAVSLVGAMLGIAIPLAVALLTSINAFDILVWGSLSLIIQIVVYRAIDLVLRDMPTRIQDGEIGPALVLVGAKLSVSLFNAAAVAG